MAFLRGALEAVGLVTAYQDANGIERQVFGGHACRVAGATFLAARGIPMAVIQLLNSTRSRRRWRSRRRRLKHALAGTAPGRLGRRRDR